MKKIGLACCLAVVASFALAPSAHAITKFKSAFKAKYVDKSQSEELKAAFKNSKTGSCFTCHTVGKPKKVANLNEFGKELSKLIEGDANQRIKDARKIGSDERKAEEAKILKEFDAAIEKVVKMKNKAGEVYAEKIKEGKLPAAK